MADLRGALLARLAEIREAEKAASPGPWYVDNYTTRREETEDRCGVRHHRGGSVVRNVIPRDAALIALARSVLGPLVEGLAEEVGRHTYRPHGNGGPGFFTCDGCHRTVGPPFADCGLVRRWAERLGVTVEEGS